MNPIQGIDPAEIAQARHNRMLLTSQRIQAKASTARPAMVEDVRRHQGIGQYLGGGS